MKIEYHCKFCGKPGTAEAEEIPGIELAVEKWKPLLCCDRCADFMTARRSVIEQIKRVCEEVIQARLVLKPIRLKDIEEAARAGLIEGTKRFTRLVCEYKRTMNIWDIEFVNLLMDKPTDLHAICAGYQRMITTPQSRPVSNDP
jgi:hypothetical protein